MPNYDFKKDLPIAKKTENEIALLLANKFRGRLIRFNNTNKYDIKMRIGSNDYTFEVKEDFTCERTGNVGLEFECRGKPSGIEVTEADYYVYKIHTKDEGIKIYMHKTDTIKKMIKDGLYFRIVNGGDEGSNSMNYLFKYEIFIKGALLISQIS